MVWEDGGREAPSYPISGDPLRYLGNDARSFSKSSISLSICPARDAKALSIAARSANRAC